MPTIKKLKGQYRFFFYSFDCNEAKHIHIQREKMVCKFWLEPIVLGNNYGFSPKEVNSIRKIVYKNLNKIVEAWYDHCDQTTGNKN